MPEIAASIVTINWNSGEMTAEAIDSLLAQTIVDELEIVVVDNGSTDSSDSALEKKFGDRIILVRARSNLGYAGGSNAGAARATGRYVIFFNNDAVACAEWASQLVNAADNDDTLGMCTSRIMCYDDRSVIDNVGHNISGDGIGRSRGHLQPMSAEYKTAAETLLASGCAGLYRRDLFEQVGGFDPTAVGGFNAGQLGGFNPAAVSGFSGEQVRNIDAEAVRDLANDPSGFGNFFSISMRT